MNRSNKVSRRRLGTLLSVALIPFLLSGCFKFTMDLKVSSQDTVSGTAVVALAKELQALAQAGGEEPTDAFASLDGISVSDFDDGTYVGQQYEFSGVPIEELALIDDASALTIRRDGDNLIVSGNLSFEDEETEPAEDGVVDLGEGFFDVADLRVSITFPGEIVETNGQVNEETNTITWRPKYGQPNELEAIVYAPRGTPLWIWWTAGSLLLVALFATALVIVIRRQRTQPRKMNGLESAAAVEIPKGASTGFPRSDRPVFSYQVRSGLFSKERFELRLYDEELVFAFVTNLGNLTTDAVVIKTRDISDVSRIDGAAGLGVRLVHGGQVEVLPAKPQDAGTLVSLLKTLSSATEFDTQTTPEPAMKKRVDSVTKKLGPPNSFVEDIRELHRLMTEGIITQSEFDEMKAKRIEKE